MGEWRWQAGWIKFCPPDLGWLQPSAIITSQVIPAGGFPNPTAGFLEIWWNELLAAGFLIIAGVCMLVIMIKKHLGQFSSVAVYPPLIISAQLLVSGKT